MARRAGGWMSLALNTWAANMEAQQVIALRLAKFARGGPEAAREAARMVAEKADAAGQVNRAAAVGAMTGAAASIPARTLSTYRRKMRANRRRLLKELAG